MNILLWIVFFLILGLIAFSLAGGLFIYKSLFVRKMPGEGALDREPVKGSSVLLSHLRDDVIMIPLCEAKKRWKSYPIEEIRIRSFDSVELAGYLWRSEEDLSFQSDSTDTVSDIVLDTEKSPIACLVHGFSDSASGMAYLAEEYHARGFTVLALDCRCHGESGSVKIGMGYTDAKDIVEWMKYIHKDVYLRERRIVLHGVSMGAAASLIYCGSHYALYASQMKYTAPDVIVADCSFSSYYKECSYQLSRIISGRFLQRFLRFLLILGASFMCFICNGFSFARISPIRSLKRAASHISENTSIILFHGEKDILVPPSMCVSMYVNAQKKMKKMKKSNANFLKMCIIDEAPHIGAYFYQPVTYFNEIMAVFGAKNNKGTGTRHE